MTWHTTILPPVSSPSGEMNLWEPRPAFSEETERIMRMTVDRKRNCRRAEPVSEPVPSILLLHTMRDPNTLYSHAGTCCEPFHTFISVEGLLTYFTPFPSPTILKRRIRLMFILPYLYHHFYIRIARYAFHCICPSSLASSWALQHFNLVMDWTSPPVLH